MHSFSTSPYRPTSSSPVEVRQGKELLFADPPTMSPVGAFNRDARPFHCDEPGCYLSFKRKFTLTEHIKTHTGEKPYECPVKSCRKAFTTSGNLSRHKRLHPWLKPQTCLVVGCGRTFSNEIQFERHTRKHFRTPTVRQPCPTDGCNKAFTTRGNLRRHIRQHHDHSGTKQGASLSQDVGDPAVDRAPRARAESSEELDDLCVQRTPKGRGFCPLDEETLVISEDELLEALQCLF